MMPDHDRAVAAAHRAASELQQTEAAFEKVRVAMTEHLLRSTPEQAAFRDRMIAGVQIIDAVKAALLEVVLNGQTAEAALAQENLLRR